jgi:hypothetical protein
MRTSAVSTSNASPSELTAVCVLRSRLSAVTIPGIGAIVVLFLLFQVAIRAIRDWNLMRVFLSWVAGSHKVTATGQKVYIAMRRFCGRCLYLS